MTNTTAQQHEGQQTANKANKSCYSTTANVNCKLRPGPSDNASSSWTDSEAALLKRQTILSQTSCNPGRVAPVRAPAPDEEEDGKSFAWGASPQQNQGHELVAASSLAVKAVAARFHGTFGLRPFPCALAKQTSRNKRDTRDKF